MPMPPYGRLSEPDNSLLIGVESFVESLAKAWCIGAGTTRGVKQWGQE